MSGHAPSPPPLPGFAVPGPGDLGDFFDDLDVYLFDQLLKGRITTDTRLLDAGCGVGRNLVYLMRSGVPVVGIDRSVEALKTLRRRAMVAAPWLPATNFRVEAVEAMSFADGEFDVVVSNAVLHFADDEEHFRAMVAEMGRVLRPGGMLFARLATTITVEGRFESLGGRAYLLPDGGRHFLADRELLAELAEELGADLLEPLKTVNVEDRRAMTTWVLRKR